MSSANNIKNSISEIKSFIAKSKNDYQIGIISSAEKINISVLKLTNEISNLPINERKTIEADLMEIIIEMRNMNDAIDNQMKTLQKDLASTSRMNFETDIQKPANDDLLS